MSEMLSLIPDNFKKIDEIYDVDFNVNQIINKINSEDCQKENNFDIDLSKNDDSNDDTNNKCFFNKENINDEIGSKIDHHKQNIFLKKNPKYANFDENRKIVPKTKKIYDFILNSDKNKYNLNLYVEHQRRRKKIFNTENISNENAEKIKNKRAYNLKSLNVTLNKQPLKIVNGK